MMGIDTHSQIFKNALREVVDKIKSIAGNVNHKNFFIRIFFSVRLIICYGE